MTRKELSQLYYLNREIALDKQRLAELKARATSTSSGLSGMPQSGQVSDKTSLAVEIAYQRDIIKRKLERTVLEYERISAYINTIDDSLTRQIFTLRFICGYSWVKVAARLGGGNTPDMARQRCYRYLKSN